MGKACDLNDESHDETCAEEAKTDDVEFVEPRKSVVESQEFVAGLLVNFEGQCGMVVEMVEVLHGIPVETVVV